MRRLFWQEEEFYAKEIVKAFNASQLDIQVNLHILDKESYDSEITERIRAGEKVDVLISVGFPPYAIIRLRSFFWI